MSTTVETHPFTPEDLLTMPDGQRFELVDGQLVEQNVSGLSSWVGGELHALLRNYCREHNLGWVWPADNLYRCFPWKPNLVRRPDVSFIQRDRLTAEQLSEGFLTIPPDLAIEVVSPNDIVYELDEKLSEYLDAGVRLIWVVNPKARTVMSFRADGSVSRLREQDELSGEEIVPGFHCRVAELFPTSEPDATRA